MGSYLGKRTMVNSTLAASLGLGRSAGGGSFSGSSRGSNLDPYRSIPRDPSKTPKGRLGDPGGGGGTRGGGGTSGRNTGGRITKETQIGGGSQAESDAYLSSMGWVYDPVTGRWTQPHGGRTRGIISTNDPAGGGDGTTDPTGGGGTGSGTGQGIGSFNWSPEQSALMARLTGRANEFLDRKPGYGESVIRNMFGANYDKIRGAGNATNQATMANLSSEGLLGTGAGANALNDNAWNTEAQVGGIKRDVMIANEAQKRSDLVGFTNAAQSLAQQGMSFEQIKEQLNSGRRMEAQSAMGLWLQYLMGMTNSWKG